MKSFDLKQLVLFVDGELDDDEKRDISDRLRTDRSLYEMMILVKEVNNVLSDNNLISFKECIIKAKKEFLITEKCDEKNYYPNKRTERIF
ncbi:MAG TPA: hypothetical protein VIH57_12210 [Bacteroidales bacterium]